MLPMQLLLAATLAAPMAGKASPGDWPQFRGPNRDGASTETGLLQEWPKGGPKKDWTITGCGGGYGTVAVSAGFIYGTGRIGGKEYAWCLSEKDGKEVWNVEFAEGKRSPAGYDEGPRGTPTVVGDKVYVVSVGGELACLAAKDGKKIWSKNYVKDFKGGIPGWGYSESVLVDGEQVIGTPCSNSNAMVALKADTGELIWNTEIKSAGAAGGYSSPAKMTVNKVDMYVTLLGKAGGVVGIDAKTGKALWQYTKVMNGVANIPTPVVKDAAVWCSTGYGEGGSALLNIKESQGKFEAEEVKYYNNKELQNHHGGMVLAGDYVYFGHAHNNGYPACVELKTGEIKWKENKGAGGGRGSGCVVYADGMLYFRYQNGTMALVKASPDKFELKGSFEIPDKSGKDSWQHPVVANGKLYIRDQDKLHCFDVKK